MQRDPASSDWRCSENEEVEQLQGGGMNSLSAGSIQHSQEEIIKPVQNIDEEKSCGENSAGMAINVVWIFHNEDRCCSAGRIFHG